MLKLGDGMLRLRLAPKSCYRRATCDSTELESSGIDLLAHSLRRSVLAILSTGLICLLMQLYMVCITCSMFCCFVIGRTMAFTLTCHQLRSMEKLSMKYPPLRDIDSTMASCNTWHHLLVMILVNIYGWVNCSWSMLISCFSSFVVTLTCVDVGLPLYSDHCTLVLLTYLLVYTWHICEFFGFIWT